MNARQLMSVWTLGCLTLFTATKANAITVPDVNSSCSNGQGRCLKITHNGTSLNDDAIMGVTGNQTGVYGYSSSTSGGIGVYGLSYAQSNTGAGVLGAAGAPSGSNYGVGVKGTANSGSTAIWGYNPSSTAGYFSGNVYYTGTLAQDSDVRLKKDIKEIPYGLNQVLQMHLVTYKFKEGDDRSRLGVIAQEMQKVVPELVQTDPHNGMLTVDYVALAPIMLKAVQEQQRIIERQEARIVTLERGRSPVLSSFFSGGLGGAMTLGLVPVGLFLAIRRRKESRTRPQSD